MISIKMLTSQADDLSNAGTDVNDIEKIDDINMDVLTKVCTDFVNESDTIIGMESYWTEYLVKEYYVDLDKDAIKNALNVPNVPNVPNQDIIMLTVKLFQAPYGDRQWFCSYGDLDVDVYVAIHDYSIVISTREWLVYTE
jgi:hypothetical protein